ncbi:MAG: hypothetical protein ACOCQX_00375 [Candidatus Nanoarchaeia archaeon]
MSSACISKRDFLRVLALAQPDLYGVVKKIADEKIRHELQNWNNVPSIPNDVKLDEIVSDNYHLTGGYNYKGPRLHLFLDFNINSSEPFKALKDVETIIYEPCQKNNIKKIPRKFGKIIPAELYCGMQALEKRCSKEPGSPIKDFYNYYTQLARQFNSDISWLRKVSDKHKKSSPQKISEMLSKYTDRRAIISAEIANYRKLTAYTPDRVLAALTFGFNIMDPVNKNIVISDDSGLRHYFALVHATVLPQVIARYAYENNGKKSFFGRKRKFLEEAKRYLGGIHAGSELFTAGVLFVPSEKKFYTYSLPADVLKYFGK